MKESPKIIKTSQQTACDIFVTNVLCSIRTKTILTLVIAFLIFYAAILGLVLGIFPNTFYTFELEQINTKSRTINRVFQDVAKDVAQFTTQNIAAFDSQFDASNEYLASGDFATFEAFVDSYWPGPTFANYKVDFCAYYFLNGSKILDRYYNRFTTNFELNALPKLLEKFPFRPYLDDQDTNRRDMAFILHNGVSYLITGVPIQTTNFGGPIPGTIVTGRIISQEFLNDMALRSQLCVTLYTFNNRGAWAAVNGTDLPSTFYSNPIKANISDDSWADINMQYVSVLSKSQNLTQILSGRNCYPSAIDDPVSQQESLISADRLQGYNLYSDINGDSGILVRVDVKRTSYDLGRLTILIILLVLAAVGFVFFVLIEFLLETCVLFKMTRLTWQVRNIRLGIEKDKSNHEFKVTVPSGNDEIQYLALEMNHLLAQIQQNNKKMENYVNILGSEEAAIRTMINSLPDSVLIYNTIDGSIHSTNSTFEKTFYSATALKDKTIFDILPSVKENQSFLAGILHNHSCQANGMFGTKIRALLHCVSLPKSRELVEGKHVEVARNMVVIHDDREKEETEAKLKQQMKMQVVMKQQIQFEEQFNDDIIRLAFIKFCTKEKTLENVNLLIEIENYRKVEQASRLKKQKVIFDRFLKPGAKEGVNISNETKTDAINKCTNGIGQIDLFSSLEKAIRFNLMNESFSRFQEVKNNLIDEVLKDMEDKGKRVSQQGPNLNVVRGSFTSNTGSNTGSQLIGKNMGFLQNIDDSKIERRGSSFDKHSDSDTKSAPRSPNQTPIMKTPENEGKSPKSEQPDVAQDVPEKTMSSPVIITLEDEK